MFNLNHQLRTHEISPWLIALFIGLAGIGFAEVSWAHTLHVAEDAHVDLVDDAANFGTSPNLIVQNVEIDKRTGVNQTYLRFSLVTLPDAIVGADVEKATLRLWVEKVETPGPVDVYLVLSPWDEHSITGATLPASVYLATVSITTDDEGHYLPVDITGNFQDWVDRVTPNEGLALVPGIADVKVRFSSKEHPNTPNPVEIEVAYVGPEGPEGPQGVQGKIGPEGPQGVQGKIGPEGPQGAQGKIGPQGDPGPQGVQGKIGPEGPQGIQGKLGPEGPQGVQGKIGPQGIAGLACWDLNGDGLNDPAEDINGDGVWDALDCTGPQGVQGKIGPQGDEGPQGVQGKIGPEGPQGVQGKIGPEGPQGVQGKIGPEGPQGVQGKIGPQGDTGPQGEQGKIGPQGPAGSANINGTSNFVIKFTGATAGGNSQIYDNGTNVGIGDSSPASKLNVASAASADGIYIDNTAETGDPILSFQLSGSSQFTMGVDDSTPDDDFMITTSLGLDHHLSSIAINGNTGNVGIGANAGDSGEQLHVRDDDAATTTVTDLLRLSHYTSSVGEAGFGAGIRWVLENNAGNGNEAASLDVVWEDATPGSTDSSMRFNTAKAGTLSESMRIDDLGNVGIGTTSPAARLHVLGNLRISGPIENAGGNVLIEGGGQWFRSYGNGGWINQSWGGGFYMQDSTWIRTFNNKGIYTGGIISAGQIGIGTTSPNDALDIVGDVDATGCFQVNDTTTIGGTCVSDWRLKRNVRPMSGSLDLITSLRPVRFEYTSSSYGAGLQEGLIAQEVEEVFPDWVVIGEDGYKRITYGLPIQIHLIQAVKELKAQNEELKAENETLRRELETESASLKKRIAEIEAKLKFKLVAE